MGRAGWRTPAVILACGGRILMLALGTRQSLGLFLPPDVAGPGMGTRGVLVRDRAAEPGGGLAMLFAGAVADRYGAGRVLAAGGLAYGLGLVAMAYSASPLAFNFAAGLLVGLGLACTGFGVVLAVVARAFPPEKAASQWASPGPVARSASSRCCPGGQALISGYGWLAALLALGVLAFLMIALGAAFAGRNAAAQERDQSMGAALAEAMAHRGFWLPTGRFFVCGLQTIFVMTHLPAYLVDQGLTPMQGMIALAVLGLFNIHGSYGAGAFGARRSKRLLLAWISVTHALAIGVFLAAPLTAAGTCLFAAVLGLTWLGTVPLTNSLVGQIFRVKYLSTLFSIAFLGHQLDAFVGVWAGGAILDLTGSCRLLWLAAIALSVVAAALRVPVNERTIERPAVRGTA